MHDESAASGGTFVVAGRGPETATLITILTVAMAMGTAGVALFSVMSPFLIEDLGLSRAELGVLITTVAASGAVMSLIAGPISDRIGGRRMTAAVFAVAVATYLGLATAPGLGVAAAVAVVAGLGNGACNPATNQLVAGRLPAGRRGLSMGIKQSGVQAGIFLSGLVLPPLAMVIGWREALAFAGAVPLVFLVATLRLLPTGSSGDHDPVDDLAAVTQAMTTRVRWLTVYGALMGAGGAAVVGFLPLYAREEIGLSAVAAGMAAAVMGLIGVVVRILTASRAEHLNSYPALLGTMSMLAVFAIGSLVLADVAGRVPLFAGAMLAGASVGAWNAVAMLAVVAREEEAVLGRATGFVNFGFLAGMASGPLAFGWLVDRVDRYTPAWGAVMALFAIASAAMGAWKRSEARTA